MDTFAPELLRVAKRYFEMDLEVIHMRSRLFDFMESDPFLALASRPCRCAISLVRRDSEAFTALSLESRGEVAWNHAIAVLDEYFALSLISSHSNTTCPACGTNLP